MVAISEVVSKTDFKFSLERDPPMDLVEFYLEAERYPRGGLPEAGYGKDKAKWKDDDFGKPKRQRGESKFSSYIDLTETPER